MKYFHLFIFFIYNILSNIFINSLFYLYIVSKTEKKTPALFLQYIFPSLLYYIAKTVSIFSCFPLRKNYFLLLSFAIFNFLFSINFDRLLKYRLFIIVISFNHLFVGITDGYIMKCIENIELERKIRECNYINKLFYRYIGGIPITLIAIVFNILDRNNQFMFIYIAISVLFLFNILLLIANGDNLIDRAIYEKNIIDINLLVAYIISSITEVIVYSVLYLNYSNNPFLLYYFSFDYFLKLFTLKIPKNLSMIFSFLKILFCSITLFLLIYQRFINKYLLLSICLINGISHQLILNTFIFQRKLNCIIEILIFIPLIILAYSLFNKIDFKGLLYYSPVRL